MLFINHICQITRELESTICIKFDPLLIWVVWWQPHHGVDDPFWVIYDINSEPDLFLGRFHRKKWDHLVRKWPSIAHLLITKHQPDNLAHFYFALSIGPLNVDQWNTTKRAFFSLRFRLNPMSGLLGCVMLTHLCLPKWTPFGDRQRHGKTCPNHLEIQFANSFKGENDLLRHWLQLFCLKKVFQVL